MSKKTTKKPVRRVRPKAQPHHAPLFELRKSPIQGTGAFALQKLRKGTRLIEYVGEIISTEEADRRYDDSKMKRHHTFLFSLDNGSCIDAAVGGNDARFINHSCEPNCEAYEVRNRIFIRTLRTVQPGEELTYDYAFERDGENDAEWEKLYICKCGAPNCRGTILAPKPEPKAKRASAAGKGAKNGTGTGVKTKATADTVKKGAKRSAGTR